MANGKAYTKLWRENLRLAQEVRTQQKEIITLKEELARINKSIDGEVLLRMDLTKKRIDKMVARIDKAIEREVKSIPGPPRASPL